MLIGNGIGLTNHYTDTGFKMGLETMGDAVVATFIFYVIYESHRNSFSPQTKYKH